MTVVIAIAVVLAVSRWNGAVGVCLAVSLAGVAMVQFGRRTAWHEVTVTGGYLGVLAVIAAVFAAAASRDLATSPEIPWTVTEVNKPVGEGPGYVPPGARPPAMLYAIQCQRGNTVVLLTHYGYSSSGFRKGENVYLVSGLTRANRDAVGYRLERVNYSRYAPR